MPLTDDQLRAIGWITVAFGQLEFSASLLLRVLINPTNQDIGRVVFERAPFGRVLEMIDKLCPYTLADKPELYRQVKEWIPRAKGVAERRNEVLHALWAENQPSGEMVALTRRATKTARTRATDLDRLAIEVAREAKEVDEMLLELLPGRYSSGTTES
jgi:hypothetical protein